jgi:hypothetical protein
VKHEKGTGVFCWAQHAFKVLADKKEGVYKCECMVVLHARDQSIHPPASTEHTREVHSAVLHT